MLRCCEGAGWQRLNVGCMDLHSPAVSLTRRWKFNRSPKRPGSMTSGNSMAGMEQMKCGGSHFATRESYCMRWELKQQTMCWTNWQSYGRIAQDMRMAEVMDCSMGGYARWFLVQVAIGRDGWSMRRGRQSRTPFGREQMSG